MGTNPFTGWSVPVFQSITNPRLALMAGVPPGFLILTFLGSILGLFVSWWSLVLGGGLYLSGAALTAWEPQWHAKLKAYLAYKVHYDG